MLLGGVRVVHLEDVKGGEVHRENRAGRARQGRSLEHSAELGDEGEGRREELLDTHDHGRDLARDEDQQVPGAGQDRLGVVPVLRHVLLELGLAPPLVLALAVRCPGSLAREADVCGRVSHRHGLSRERGKRGEDCGPERYRSDAAWQEFAARNGRAGKEGKGRER